MSQLRTRQPIGGFSFEGPYRTLERVPGEEGLLAVVTTDGRQNYLLDVLHVLNMLEAIKSNPRRRCWRQNSRGMLLYAFLRDEKLDTDTLTAIAGDIRKNINLIPCG
ncbi:hypothetical protein JXL21_08000 [Candidatus Bathyarchaeota archaeon]|nr:hypothetical protein [Candidatus Bathyarchaeota archaeon]